MPIPGTTKLHRLQKNLAAADVVLTVAELHQIEVELARIEVVGDRYPTQLAALTGR